MSEQNKSVDSVADGLRRAGKMGEVGGTTDFSDAQSREAISTAKIDAAGVGDTDEAMRRAKRLHQRLGSSPNAAGSAAIDAYRERAARLSDNVDNSLLDDESIDNSKVFESAGLYSRPEGSPFEQLKREKLNQVGNRRRRAEKQRGKNDEAAMLRRREARLESAETEDDISRAMGELPADESADLRRRALEKYHEGRSTPRSKYAP